MGNIPGGHRRGSTASDGGYYDTGGAASPPDSPGHSGQRSPLSFGPQIPMVPIPKEDELVLGGGGVIPDYPAVAGWPAQPTLVPTPITWSHGGSHVEVEGSFDNWTTRQPLHQHGTDFTIVKLLLPGVYQYKFIVDGEWKYAPEQPAMYDDQGNVNNVIEVREYQPEKLENLSNFTAPSSPRESYTNPLPTADDFAKEPPQLPPQLQLTLLNVPPLPEAPNLLPRPQHVVLNHAYLEKPRHARGCTAVGITHRYRSKYVTVVVFKPLKPRRAGEA